MRKNKLKSLIIQRQGFTLIELIAVIAIVGVLAAAAVPAIGNVVQRSQVTQVTSDIKVVSDAVTAYINDVRAVPVVNLIADTNQIQLKGQGVTTWSKDVDGAFPGISVRAFKKAAQDNTYYMIDMSKLTKKQVAIDNPTQWIEPKLNSIPTSSAVASIEDKGTTSATTANSSVKNTSVIYVIDKNLKVSAVTNPELISKTSVNAVTNTTSLPAAGSGTKDSKYCLLNPTEDQNKAAGNNKGDAHEVFGVPYIEIANTSIANGLAAKDTAYKN